MQVDFHIHTIATPHHSFWEPHRLVTAAQAAGLNMIAITDHNTTAQVRTVQQAAAGTGLQVISGVEIDTSFGGKLWHTLLYGADPEHPDVLELCQSVIERNRADAQKLATAMRQQGQQLPFLDTIEAKRSPNLADVAHALVKAGIWPQQAGIDDESAGMAYLLQNMPEAYQPLSVQNVVDVANSTGGVAILAHPGREKSIYAIPATEADIEHMVAIGLHGIEVYYPTHRTEQIEFYHRLAKKHKLLETAGSDSHGPQNTLGTYNGADCRAFIAQLANG